MNRSEKTYDADSIYNAIRIIHFCTTCQETQILDIEEVERERLGPWMQTIDEAFTNQIDPKNQSTWIKSQLPTLIVKGKCSICKTFQFRLVSLDETLARNLYNRDMLGDKVLTWRVKE